MSETIIVRSDINSDIFPDNNGGSFRNNFDSNKYFQSNSRVRISEIAFQPNSYYNVREGTNTISIEMSNLIVEKYSKAKVYVDELTYQTRKVIKKSKRGVAAPKVVDQFRLKLRRRGDGNDYVDYYSEWTPGEPYDLTKRPDDINDLNRAPICRTIKFDKDQKLPQFNTNARNKLKVYIQATGRGYKVDPVSAEFKLTEGYYYFFPDFQLMFANCFDKAINELFEEHRAIDINEYPRIPLGDFKNFNISTPILKSAWVFLKIARVDNEIEVAHLMVSHEFQKKTNFQMKLPSILQEQLGFTVTGGYIHLNHIRRIETEVERQNYMYTKKLGFMQMHYRELFVENPARFKKQVYWDVDYAKIWEVAAADFLPSDTFIKEGDKPNLMDLHLFPQLHFYKMIKTIPYLFPAPDPSKPLKRQANHLYGNRVVDLNYNTLRYIFVFCDIVEPSYVNDKQMPILCVTSLLNKSFRSFEHHGTIDFKKINKSVTDHINIRITETPEGKPIVFMSPVAITLEFHA